MIRLMAYVIDTNIKNKARGIVKDLIKSLLEAGKLDAESAGQLNNEADELESKLKTARGESAERRTKSNELKARIAELENSQTSILEALGVDPDEDLNIDDLANKAKGKTEADDQLKSKIKRLEKELETSNAERGQIVAKYESTQKQAALNKALSQHKWIDSELVEQVLSKDVVMNEDGFFINDVALDDAVKNFAAEKPHLIEADGKAGSGFKQSNQGSQINPFAKETRNLTEQARIIKENPQLAQSLKSQAGV